jgi:hypothetical protein
MGSKVMRLPDDVAAEAAAASRVLGRPAGELFAEAWRAYRETDRFKHMLTAAQKAFAAGDLEFIARQLEENAQTRAADKAASILAMRNE